MFFYFLLINKEKKPSIGILNIGTENNKGLEFLQEGSELIASSFLKDYFVGFIEPNKITSGDCDIIVSDGYTGNIILKTAEGLSDFITKNLKSSLNKFSVLLSYGALKKFKEKLDPRKHCQFHCIRHNTNILLEKIASGENIEKISDYDRFM